MINYFTLKIEKPDKYTVVITDTGDQRPQDAMIASNNIPDALKDAIISSGGSVTERSVPIQVAMVQGDTVDEALNLALELIKLRLKP